MAVPAVKASIGQVLSGFDGEEGATFIGGKRAFRVRVMGRVLRKFVNDEGTYGNVVLDDETGTIRAKFFSQGIRKLEGIRHGDLLEVLGRVRQFQEEVHLIADEVAVLEDVNWEFLRKLELAVPDDSLEKEVLKELKRSTRGLEELTKEFGGEAEEALKSLLEKGEVYEASPGKYRPVE